MEVKKIYHTKAIHSLVLSPSCYTRPLSKLTDICLAQNWNSLEFIIWFDYTLIEIANLSKPVFDCILDLVEKGHIVKSTYTKDFRFACILLQKFVDSDHTSNLIKVKDFLQDCPQYIKYTATTPIQKLDYDNLLNYDRVLANKRMFPYFHSKSVSKELVAELISRGLLAYDTRFNNLIYICKFSGHFWGVEKHGTGTKHYQQLVYNDKQLCFIYKIEKLLSWDEAPIEKAVFFDNTLNMLKYLSSEYVEENTAYCSLHTPSCHTHTFTNTLELLGNDIEVEFNFLDETSVQRFETVYTELEHKSKVTIKELYDTLDNDDEFDESDEFIANSEESNPTQELPKHIDEDDDLPF